MKALFERVGVFTTPALALVILIGACYVFFSEPAAVSVAQDAKPNPRTYLNFEYIQPSTLQAALYRARVPGGWLVAVDPHIATGVSGITFVPDPEHSWDVSEPQK